MIILTISAVTFGDLPSVNSNGTLSYKMFTTGTQGNYIGVTPIIIRPDGTLVTPVEYNLQPSTEYLIKASLDCGNFYIKRYKAPATPVNQPLSVILTSSGPSLQTWLNSSVAGGKPPYKYKFFAFHTGCFFNYPPFTIDNPDFTTSDKYITKAASFQPYIGVTYQVSVEVEDALGIKVTSNAITIKDDKYACP